MLAGVDSPTYNHGRFFVAPFPMATYDLGPVKLNAIYVPRYQQNRFAVFGLYFSIRVGAHRSALTRGLDSAHQQNRKAVARWPFSFPLMRASAHNPRLFFPVVARQRTQPMPFLSGCVRERTETFAHEGG